MPGTFGTLAAVPLYWGLQQSGSWLYGWATVLSVIIGIVICDKAAEKLQIHDFGGIVWDEVAGFLITMCAVSYSWQSLLAGFILFRLLDIFKPWPIRWLDKHVTGGLGIMLDDVVAGAIAALMLGLWF